MKKSLLTAAIVLGSSAIIMASEQSPMALNQDGIGQVLIYPYYNVNDGFDTHFTVVNTSGDYRAVKVRINEGKNSWEVLDFNLYLSPYDVWAGALHKYEDDGKIRILTSDTSCTLPAIITKAELDKELAALKNGTASADFGIKDPALRYFNLEKIEAAKTDDQGRLVYTIQDNADKYTPEYLAQRASEGYIEVIDMGAIPRVEDKDGKDKLQDAIKHGSNGKPGNCEYLAEFHNTNWATAKGGNPDFRIIADGKSALMGNATLINVGQGLSGGYNAIAIKNFINADSTVANQRKDGKVYTLHNNPGSSFPNLNGQVERGTNNTLFYPESLNKFVQVNDAKNATGDATKGIFVISGKALKQPNGNVTYAADKAAVALSAVLMTEKVIGEYVVEKGLNGSSDWVLTMPTKHFFTNINTFDADARGLGQFGFVTTSSNLSKEPATAPFRFTAYNKRTPLLVEIDAKIYNREELDHQPKAGIDFSPSIDGDKLGINAEAALLSFTKDPSKQIFKSGNRSTIDAKFESGWAEITVSTTEKGSVLTALQNKASVNNTDKNIIAVKDEELTTGDFRLKGLPVVGISATKYVNGNIGGGVLSNYMAIQNLNYVRNNIVVE